MPPYELVAMGASWGGLSAIQRILGALPGDFAPPIAIAQHRAHDSDAHGLCRMFQRHARRPVREASDKDPIVPGEVFLAPADYHLLVEVDGFALSTDGAVQYSRPSIDVLFDTAADVYGERLVAVLLTGANADGAYGIARVQRRGGYTIVQDPTSAERSEMPTAAIATGAVDRIAELGEIAQLLVDLCSRPAIPASGDNVARRLQSEPR